MAEVLLNPALVLILGAAVLPLLRTGAQRVVLLALPLAALAVLVSLPRGERGRIAVLGLELVTIRLDRLSFVFGLVFLLAAVLAVGYSWHLRDTAAHVAGVLYAGAAVGALLAGDLLTLFFYWELTSVASAVLIWTSRTEASYRAAMRYLMIQIVSGVALLGGAVWQLTATGSLRFEPMEPDNPVGLLVLFAFGVKCAFPLLHNWLQDAYPEATVTGTVWLSVYTTKLAVYALARGFAGLDLLVWVGVAMTLFPIFYAVIENNLRRVLSYSLNNQLGFMVCGIGIGTDLAVNGAVAHAFAHIIYKALLFMAMGAVLHRVGTVLASQLGGLYKSMPWTAGMCIIGSMSISAVPLLSGFVTKSLILSGAVEDGRWLVYLLLLVASAGVVDHSGIKIPFFAFFAHDSGKRCREAPLNMRLAMGAAAALCIGIGLWPQPLYDLLPHSVDYSAFTASHTLTQLQLVLFAAAAFVLLYRSGRYPPELRSTNLDSDWIYRNGLPQAVRAGTATIDVVRRGVGDRAARGVTAAYAMATKPLRVRGALSVPWSTGAMVWWIAVLLGLFLILSLF